VIFLRAAKGNGAKWLRLLLQRFRHMTFFLSLWGGLVLTQLQHSSVRALATPQIAAASAAAAAPPPLLCFHHHVIQRIITNRFRVAISHRDMNKNSVQT
jgi:hypothetical protein